MGRGRPGDATMGAWRTVTAVIRRAWGSADGLAPAAVLRRRTHAKPHAARRRTHAARRRTHAKPNAAESL